MDLMIQLLDSLTPWGTQSLVAIFLLLIACGFGLPMPEDVILVTAGILAARNITDYSMTQFVCFTGVILGDLTVFLIGKRFGPVIKSRGVFRRIFTPERDAQVARIFNTWGLKVIFAARFMPGLRMPVFLTAGTWQVPTWKFLALDGGAAILSVPLWIMLGHAFGSRLEELAVVMNRFQSVLLGLTAVVVLSVPLILLRNRRRKRLS
jgi:membrane protein DedA with SNARE-associated domain